jgi:hypothetical protein
MMAAQGMQQAQGSIGQQNMAVPNSVTPVVQMQFKVDGVNIGEAISIPVPAVLSDRVKKMHIIEQSCKALKGPALNDVVKALGRK